MSDTPKIHATLSDLDASAKAGPFVQALKNNKRITFPDPGEMEWTEAIDLVDDITSNARAAMKKWLSEADYNKLLEAKLTLYQFSELGRRVGQHYQAILGEPGN